MHITGLTIWLQNIGTATDSFRYGMNNFNRALCPGRCWWPRQPIWTTMTECFNKQCGDRVCWPSVALQHCSYCSMGCIEEQDWGLSSAKCDAGALQCSYSVALAESDIEQCIPITTVSEVHCAVHCTSSSALLQVYLCVKCARSGAVCSIVEQTWKRL